VSVLIESVLVASCSQARQRSANIHQLLYACLGSGTALGVGTAGGSFKNAPIGNMHFAVERYLQRQRQVSEAAALPSTGQGFALAGRAARGAAAARGAVWRSVGVCPLERPEPRQDGPARHILPGCGSEHSNHGVPMAEPARLSVGGGCGPRTVTGGQPLRVPVSVPVKRAPASKVWKPAVPDSPASWPVPPVNAMLSSSTKGLP
jgi:hypothetical protein